MTKSKNMDVSFEFFYEKISPNYFHRPSPITKKNWMKHWLCSKSVGILFLKKRGKRHSEDLILPMVCSVNGRRRVSGEAAAGPARFQPLDLCCGYPCETETQAVDGRKRKRWDYLTNVIPPITEHYPPFEHRVILKGGGKNLNNWAHLFLQKRQICLVCKSQRNRAPCSLNAGEGL